MNSGSAVRSSPNSSITRHGCHIGVLFARVAVVRDRRERPGVFEQPLPADDLTLDRGAGTPDELRIFGEVVDQAGHVGKALERSEGRAALVVDEDHGEVLGAVGNGQAQHQGTQEFGFTGTGRANADAVRAHASLS